MTCIQSERHLIILPSRHLFIAMDTSPTIRLTIAPEDDGRPLHELVAEVLGGQQAGDQLIAHGGLWVDGARMRDEDARARAGSQVAIHRPLAGAYPEVVLSLDRILYEDNDLLA